MKGYTGGIPLESCAEGTVKNSEIKTKALNTAEVILSHRYFSDINNIVNEEVSTSYFI